MNKSILICASTILLLVCFCFYKNFPEKHERLINDVTCSAEKKIKEKYALHLIGTGGQMMENIEILYMGFQYFDEVDLNIGRYLIIGAIRDYLEIINNNAKIRPYLQNQSFTEKNIEMDIYIRNQDRSEVSLDKICVIAIKKGIITYYLETPDHISFRTIHKETYEEALHYLECISE